MRISSSTHGATIRYTTDGITTPTETVGYIYSGRVTVSSTETLKAIAYETGWTDSAVVTAAYTITQTVATPRFNPVAGSYTSAQSVSITTSTPGATIRYTTDGVTAPTKTVGYIYSAPVPVSITGTLKAIAYETGWTDSAVATATYTINLPAPTLTSVSPASGVQGTSVPITLIGANFVAGATVAASKTGITVGTVTVASATQITTTLTIAATAALGAGTITVTTTSGGTSGPVSFTVNPPAPTLTAVSPAIGVQGTSVPVTLTGTNFVAGATVASSNTGITVGAITVASSTQITTTLTIAATAALGAGTITVTTSGGTSGPVIFTVNPPAPTLTAVSPAIGVQGTSVPVTLTGTNFVAGATVASSNAGITVGAVTVASSTQITATLTIAANAALGVANLTVTTSGGTSGPVSFTVNPAVNPPAPTLTTISPVSGAQGATVTLTLTGTNFVAGAQVVVPNNYSGLTVSGVTVVSPTQITATVSIPATALVTSNTIAVTTSGGTSTPKVFSVVPPPPTVTSAVPAAGVQGPTVSLALNGTNLAGPGMVTAGAGIGVSGVLFSATQIYATLTIPLTAPVGATAITVFAGGGSATTPFTVNQLLPPTWTSATPASAAQGSTVFVTFNGANFLPGATPAATLASSNPGVAISGITACTSTQITATLTIAANATAGPVTITVSTIGGSAASATFAVNQLPAITTVAPNPAAPGTQVTISGSGFGATQGTGSVWLGSTVGTVVSWSDTMVVATVAANARSGVAQIQQGGAWSNAPTFNVNTPTILTVAPASGVPGTQVTITGSGFGAAQGSGQVWLGTAAGVVQTWTDTQVVALVGAGSTTGNAQVLQGAVMSNAVPFTVNTLHITSVSPASGTPGTSVTIIGTGFGSPQGTGTVWLGSTGGQVVSWTDTQVVATVAPAAVTGVARVQQNGAWSNAVAFTVPVTGGTTATLAPNLLNMVVGDTHTIQALNSAGQPVAGLTWTSSDPTVVSLSTADPPVLTALAVGHITIAAGSASADVTVSAGTLTLGTVLWSNPGDGSGVSSIVPAVPSASGVADVFAFQSDGTVQAITSDGATAWTANLNHAYAVPDFQGGLVAMEYNSSNYEYSIVKLDGITGQPYPAYTPGPTSSLDSQFLSVHTDGTIFVLQNNSTSIGVMGIDPTTGTQKFSVPVPLAMEALYGFIIAGDGYAYLPYGYRVWDSDQTAVVTWHLAVLRVNSAGLSGNIQYRDLELEGPECRRPSLGGQLDHQRRHGSLAHLELLGPWEHHVWDGDHGRRQREPR